MVAIQIIDLLPSGWHHNACLLVSNQPFGGSEALLCQFHPLSSRKIKSMAKSRLKSFGHRH